MSKRRNTEINEPKVSKKKNSVAFKHYATPTQLDARPFGIQV